MYTTANEDSDELAELLNIHVSIDIFCYDTVISMEMFWTNILLLTYLNVEQCLWIDMSFYLEELKLKIDIIYAKILKWK